METKAVEITHPEIANALRTIALQNKWSQFNNFTRAYKYMIIYENLFAWNQTDCGYKHITVTDAIIRLQQKSVFNIGGHQLTFANQVIEVENLGFISLDTAKNILNGQLWQCKYPNQKFKVLTQHREINYALQQVAINNGIRWQSTSSVLPECTESLYVEFNPSDVRLAYTTANSFKDYPEWENVSIEKMAEILNNWKEPIKIGQYTIEAATDGAIKVGCQTIDVVTLQQIYKHALHS